MANPEHLAKLKESVRAWNDWREANPEIVPDLSGADFIVPRAHGAKRKGVSVSRAEPRKAELNTAYLSGAGCPRQ